MDLVQQELNDMYEREDYNEEMDRVEHDEYATAKVSPPTLLTPELVNGGGSTGEG